MKEEVWLILSSIELNSNKALHLIRDGSTLISEWGRVGDNLQKKSWSFSSESLAEKEFNKKIKDKLRKGYNLVEVSGTSCPAQPLAGKNSINNNLIKDIALQQIATSNEETRKLIEFLTEVNTHQILENTSFEFNKVSGAFVTPLGIAVSQNTIDKARGVLAGIKMKIVQNDYDNPETIQLANQYLRLIPQNLGHASKKLNIRTIFPGEQSIKGQADIIDALEASLKTVIEDHNKNNDSKPMFRAFDCKIDLIEDGRTFDELNRLYKSTLQNIHESSIFKLNKVYTIDIPSIRKSWENDGVKVGNIKRLYHGTKNSHLLSILKHGLVIPKPNANYINGDLFGRGIYFSDQSTKSLNYSAGYWSGTRVNRCFMFMADVSLGKTYTPKNHHDGPFPKPGYDSIFAQGGKSGVLNNEIIIPRESMCNLVYLLEFEK